MGKTLEIVAILSEEAKTVHLCSPYHRAAMQKVQDLGLAIRHLSHYMGAIGKLVASSATGCFRTLLQQSDRRGPLHLWPPSKPFL